MATTAPSPSTRSAAANAQPQSRDMVAVHLGGCLTFSQIMSCVEGSLQQIDHDTVMAHLAACPHCSTKFNLAMGSRVAKPTLFNRGRWRWWLLATAAIGGAAALLILPRANQAPPAAPKTVTVAPVPTPPPPVAPPIMTTPPPPAATLSPAAPPVGNTAPKPAPATKTMATPASKMLPPPAPAAKAPAAKLPALATVQLMTRAEAAAPGSNQGGTAGMSVEDGPSIAIDKPGGNAVVTSGFPLQIRFAAGGAAIDLESVKLICLKQPPIHLTARIKPNITATGISIGRVLLPPGTYPLQLSLRDSQGRPAKREFSITVTP